MKGSGATYPRKCLNRSPQYAIDTIGPIYGLKMESRATESRATWFPTIGNGPLGYPGTPRVTPGECILHNNSFASAAHTKCKCHSAALCSLQANTLPPTELVFSTEAEPSQQMTAHGPTWGRPTDARHSISNGMPKSMRCRLSASLVPGTCVEASTSKSSLASSTRFPHISVCAMEADGNFESIAASKSAEDVPAGKGPAWRGARHTAAVLLDTEEYTMNAVSDAILKALTDEEIGEVVAAFGLSVLGPNSSYLCSTQPRGRPVRCAI